MVAEGFNMLELLTTSRPLDETIGWRAGNPIRRDAFLTSVHAWQHLLVHTSGQKFALYHSDSIEFSAALFGAWQAGKTIYLPTDTLPATCAMLRQSVDGFLGEFPQECMPRSAPRAVADSDRELYCFHTFAPDFVGLVVHTSGSTGAAQAIPKKLSQLTLEVRTLETLFGAQLQSADIVATVSHQHIYGLLFKVLWPLMAGRAIHAQSISYPEELAALLGQRDCVLVSSPAHLKRLPDTPIWSSAASHLRAVFSSGGPLPYDAAKAAATLLGHAPIEIYGSSETGGIAWRQRKDQSDESWTPLPGVSWRINPDQSVLEVRSAHLPDNDWLALSDRALALGFNRFQLQGRADRIVKIEEKRISLDTLEKQLIASPLVDDARVIVIDEQLEQRQRVAAFVVLSEQGRAQLKSVGKLALNRALRDLLSHHVEPVALPRSWRYLDALPINAQGKTTYAGLAALLNVSGNGDQRPTLPSQRVIQKEENRVVLELSVPSDLLYLEGHFPKIPILPGVAQIDWVIHFARLHFILPPLFRSIHALKFQRVIQPEVPVELELVYEQQKGSLNFSYRTTAGQHAGGRLQFGANDV
jgi:acyl-CoA synthetase (AMP-forming)/AMP-acid ligase II/3-hydroxymyristoyl/3-hydroxydecanoyl-(acyl carrier protein) dehydratase